MPPHSIQTPPRLANADALVVGGSVENSPIPTSRLSEETFAPPPNLPALTRIPCFEEALRIFGNTDLVDVLSDRYRELRANDFQFSGRIRSRMNRRIMINALWVVERRDLDYQGILLDTFNVSACKVHNAATARIGNIHIPAVLCRAMQNFNSRAIVRSILEKGTLSKAFSNKLFRQFKEDLRVGVSLKETLAWGVVGSTVLLSIAQLPNYPKLLATVYFFGWMGLSAKTLFDFKDSISKNNFLEGFLTEQRDGNHLFWTKGKRPAGLRESCDSYFGGKYANFPQNQLCSRGFLKARALRLLGVEPPQILKAFKNTDVYQAQETELDSLIRDKFEEYGLNDPIESDPQNPSSIFSTRAEQYLDVLSECDRTWNAYQTRVLQRKLAEKVSSIGLGR